MIEPQSKVLLQSVVACIDTVLLMIQPAPILQL